MPGVIEVALEEKELVQPPPLPVAKSWRPKAVRKLVVGKVPVHMRIILKPPAANEFIFFRYCDKQDAADHVPAEETQHLGVGLVMKVLPDECYKIAWYGHDRYQDPVTASSRCGSVRCRSSTRGAGRAGRRRALCWTRTATTPLSTTAP